MSDRVTVEVLDAPAAVRESAKMQDGMNEPELRGRL